jgi:DNA polymerase delta subunit 1
MNNNSNIFEPTQDLIFQPIEWISSNNVYNSIYDSHPINSKKKMFLMRVFGVTEKGTSVSVMITGYKPYFYISIPKDVSGKTVFREIKRKIENSESPYYADSMIDYSVTNYNSLYGFSNKVKRSFLRIVFNNSISMSCVIKILTGTVRENGTVTTIPFRINDKSIRLELFESNLDPMLRFFHIMKIKPHGWLKLDAGSYVIPDHDLSTCQIDAVADWTSIKPTEISKMAPFNIACFDIECSSEDGSFPQYNRKNDKVIQIGTTIHKYGERECYLRHIVTLKDCNPIKGTVVETYSDEARLLIGWANFVHSLDPDILAGYNIYGFDMEYMYRRAEYVGCEDIFNELLTRIPNEPASYYEKKLSSSGLGDNELKIIKIPGRLAMDIFKVIQPEYKLDQYTLNFVSNYFLKDKKEDLSPQELFSNFKKGTPSDICEIATYCVQDCVLCNKLIQKLDLVAGKMALSNVCHIPLSYLLLRGQGIRSHSLVAHECRLVNTLIPTLKKPSVSESFEGAVVLPPIRGVYLEDPIPVLDFASLYPSSLISENLSHDTIVLNQESNNIINIDYLDISYDVFTGIGDEKVKVGVKTCRFSQKYEGIIPMTLKKLLSERKAKKKLMNAENDEFKKNLYDVQQLALKITANSIYGQMGASTSPIFLLDVAASTTATGRSLLNFAKWFSENVFPKIDTYDPDYKVDSIVTIYGDTDSIFTMPKIINKNGELLKEKEALAIAIQKGIRCGKEISKILKPPHDLEYEKTFWPFCLFTKKRYVGNLYEFSPEKYSLKPMGIVLKRRDNAQIVKSVYGGLIDIILNTRDMEMAKQYLTDALDDLVKGQFPLENLRVTKSLKAQYKTINKNGGKIPKPPHKILADRIAIRDPGNKFNPGDRVPYICVDMKQNKSYKLLQGHRIETPDYIIKNNLKPDYSFYITNQIMVPVMQLLTLIIRNIDQLYMSECDVKEIEEKQRRRAKYIFDKVLRIETNRQKGNLEITNWFSLSK